MAFSICLHRLIGLYSLEYAGNVCIFYLAKVILAVTYRILYCDFRQLDYKGQLRRATEMSKKNQEKKIERRRITFRLEASEAKEATLVGDFNGWNGKKHPMKRDNNGRWNKIVTLAPGRHEYKFVVDGQWQNDPGSDQVVANSFGTLNNFLDV